MNTKQIRAIVALLVLGVLLVGLAPAAAETPPPPASGANAAFRPGVVLVKLTGGISQQAAAGLRQQYNATYLRTLYQNEVQMWQVPEGEEQARSAALSTDPAVAYAEPDYVYHAIGDAPKDVTATPNDAEYYRQWGHPQMASPAGWDITTGSAAMTIAVIDTGLDMTHPDLAAKLVPGYDFVNGDNVPNDGNGHGTHVAGIAAAITNNGTGVAGMDWQARIMGVRVLDNEGRGYSSDVTNGIVWAYQNGADVLNLSLGSTDYSQTMQDAVNAAHAHGSLVVAAMGNCRTGGSGCPPGNPTSYPAGFNNVMAVAAVNRYDQYTYYSQYGLHCDVAAPGGEMTYYHDPNGIYSTMPTYPVYLTTVYGYANNYDFLQGTSQATPYVSGLATLVWSVNATLTPDQLQSAIEATATDLGPPGWDPNYGHGRINVNAALSANASPGTPVLNPIANGDGDGSYTVDWSNADYADTYTLQEDDNPSFTSPATVYSGATSEYAVTLHPAGIWYYRVRAGNPAGDSPWSNVESAGIIPGTPTLNAISNPGNDDHYQLSWSTQTGADTYVLEEADNSAFTNATIRYAGPDTSYPVTGQAGGDWYYRVSAANPAGASGWSIPQTTGVDPAAYAPPTLNPIDNPGDDGAYTVDWTGVVSATGYVLEESADPYFSNPTEVYNGANTAFAISGQALGQWYYRVRAFGPDGASPWSNVAPVAVGKWIYLPIIANQ